MYKFIRCQPHAKCPDLHGWYLILRPDDLDTLIRIHRGVCGLLYHKFGLDPRTPESEFLGMVCNPINLAAGWLVAVEKHLAAGIALAINSSGGWFPLSRMKILVEEESTRLIWPDKYKNEVVTISRWPEGRHYYLSSNKNRVFTSGKHNTYKDALQVARMYTANIQDKGC